MPQLIIRLVYKNKANIYIMRKHIITLLLALGLAIPAVTTAETLKIRPNAPERYVIKKGDTLWGISGRYLYRPWNWPQLWGWNKAQIKNPHLIFPGQVLRLTWVDGQPRLGIEGGGSGVYRMSPQARIIAEGQPITTIPMEQLKTFLERPMVLPSAEFQQAPRIVAGPESRLVLSPGDRIYARGITEGGTYYSYRSNKEVKDPDTGLVLGYEVSYGGDLATQKLTGDVQTLSVITSREEILVGDRLLEQQDARFDNFIPHPTEGVIQGKIASTYRGVAEAGPFATITLNLGSDKGIEPGHVFGIYKKGDQRRITDVDGRSRSVSIPAEEVGIAMVYRVFDKLSYAIIMNSKTNINVGDIVSYPGQDMQYLE